MTAVPNTYSEWVTVLTDFKNKKNGEGEFGEINSNIKRILTFTAINNSK